MSLLHSLLYAGDRVDDAAAGTAVGLSLVTPLAQVFGMETVPDMSITSAVVLTILTIARMHYGNIKAVESNRHQEAMVKLEVDRELVRIKCEQGRSRAVVPGGGSEPAPATPLMNDVANHGDSISGRDDRK